METYQTRDISLQEVVTQIADGRVRLPEFQRDFNWPLSDQRALLESIQKAYPVGTLLLLEVAAATSPLGQRTFSGVAQPSKKAELLVLDGQQRLSSCYAALSADSPRVFCIDLKGLYEKTGGKPRVAFDFADFITVRHRPTHIQDLLYNRNLLPFEFLTDRNGLREKLAIYRKNLAMKPETVDFGEFVDIYLEGYVDVFFDYRFPAVVLPVSLDIEAVANVFTKINTTGLRLSAFDLCVAKLFPAGLNLRDMLKEAREADQVRALDRDGTNLLQTVALLAGQSSKKAALVKNLDKTHISAHWDSAVGGITEAGNLLGSVGAPEAGSIPYDALIPALAAAVQRAMKPTNPPEKEARRWKIWRLMHQTAFLQRYNEGTDVKQVADYPVIKEWLDGGPEPAFLRETIVWQASVNFMGRSGARYRSFLALLNESGPRDLIQTSKRLGSGLPGREPAQLHHVFPRAYLKRSEPGEDVDLALNMTFLTADSNNYISDRPPSEYVENLISDIEAAGASRQLAISKVKELLAEHLVNDAGWRAILADDYRAFLEARGEAIRDRLLEHGVPVVAAPTDDTPDADTPIAEDESSADEL